MVDLERIAIWDVVCRYCKQLFDDNRLHGDSNDNPKTISTSRSFVSEYFLDELSSSSAK